MDNFFTGSHANIAHHFGKPNFELIRHDIVEPILLEARARTARRGVVVPWTSGASATFPRRARRPGCSVPPARVCVRVLTRPTWPSSPPPSHLVTG